ncbi:putative capsular polysaccharide synthesis family protein [Maricaulis sp.]|uniref:putative capsular polysaccharide synthesis family protein n=1 Tax=Maricaulis sp. TaxID=1486257 RepID=UPI002604B579|nr:putative capsular polysaccharide synthesis family protein [Maricaulis sp.]
MAVSDLIQGRSPILLWTMGKVGSSSIAYSLFLHGLDCLDIHTLDKRVIAGVQRQYRERGMTDTMEHLLRSEAAAAYLATNPGRIRLITAVRDPVARNISAFFQTQPLKYLTSTPTPELIATFMHEYPHHVPNRFFDREIRHHLGIDLLRQHFDHESGWSIYNKNNVEALVLRIDHPARPTVPALEAFLQLPVKLRTENASVSKKYSETYNQVVNSIRLPREYLENMYSSRYARFMMSDAERAEKIERWANGAVKNYGASTG